MSNFKMDDYVDVAERIHAFYERFPDGRLTSGTAPHVIEIAGKPFIAYHARAYRTADDPIPGDGWAWEPVPGPTQFTRDSELMNAETAAWGRAIVSLGFETKKIASAQEVRARTDARVGQGERPAAAVSGGGAAPAAASNGTKFAGDVKVHFGKNKDVSLRSLSAQSAKWYAETWDPAADGKTPSEKDAALKAAAVAFAADNNAVVGAPVAAGGFMEDDSIPFARIGGEGF